LKKVFAVFISLVSFAANAQPTSNEELKVMVRNDQSKRSSTKIDWAAVDLRDKERAVKVTQMLREGQIKTAEDFYNAGLIFQHGSSAEEIKLAFSLATISARLDPSHPAPKWLAAAALDRYMIWKKLPQWYGTQSQFLKETGKTQLYPILPGAVSDEERADAYVPPLSKIVADAEAKSR
jgi:hypothetical protein